VLLKLFSACFPNDLKVTDIEQEMGLDRTEHEHEAYYDDEYEVIVADELGAGTDLDGLLATAPNGTSTVPTDSEPSSDSNRPSISSRVMQPVAAAYMESPRLSGDATSLGVGVESPRRPGGLVRFSSRANLFKGTRISATPC
jgi:hypothetical protein